MNAAFREEGGVPLFKPYHRAGTGPSTAWQAPLIHIHAAWWSRAALRRSKSARDVTKYW